MVHPARLFLFSFLIVALILPPDIPVVGRGSLVIVAVPPLGDYVVVAAESRLIDLNNKPISDKSCKITELGTHTVFFAVGSEIVGTNKGTFNAFNLARQVYLESGPDAIRDLPSKWATLATDFFRRFSPASLRSLTENSGILGTGGFVGYDPYGVAVVDSETIYYPGTDDGKPTPQRDPIVRPGNIQEYGMGKELVDEFRAQNTPRAIKVIGPHSPSADPMVTADFARKAIQFAIDNSDGTSYKGWIGGPVDVAILRHNRPVEWVHRKPNCR